jgi:hypothetical protein
MKTRHLITIAALALIAWSMTSCITTTTTAPDGTVTTTTAPAPGSMESGVEVVHIIADK